MIICVYINNEDSYNFNNSRGQAALMKPRTLWSNPSAAAASLCCCIWTLVPAEAPCTGVGSYKAPGDEWPRQWWWQGRQRTWGAWSWYSRNRIYIWIPWSCHHISIWCHTPTKHGITQNGFSYVTCSPSSWNAVHMIKSKELLCSRLQTSLDIMTEMILCRWHVARLRPILMKLSQQWDHYDNVSLHINDYKSIQRSVCTNTSSPCLLLSSAISCRRPRMP